MSQAESAIASENAVPNELELGTTVAVLYPIYFFLNECNSRVD
jgi:hypothetical protein